MHTLAKSLFALGAVGLSAASVSTAQTTVLINDDFTSAVRVGTAPNVQGIDRNGGTSRDYIVATNGDQSMAVGSGTDNASDIASGINGNSFRIINVFNAYGVFTTFASTTLNPGDTLTVSANVRTSVANVNASGSGAFRIGLFDHGDTIQSNNVGTFGGFPSTTFNDDQGYIANYSTNFSGFATVAAQGRSGGSATSAFAGTLEALGAGTAGTSVIPFDTNLAVSFVLTRSLDGSSVSISSTFNGASVTQSDATGPYTTFNQLGIFFGSGWGNAGTPRANFIDDVSVIHTSAIPEPSTFAALAGVAVLGLAASRRRRN